MFVSDFNGILYECLILKYSLLQLIFACLLVFNQLATEAFLLFFSNFLHSGIGLSSTFTECFCFTVHGKRIIEFWTVQSVSREPVFYYDFLSEQCKK